MRRYSPKNTMTKIKAVQPFLHPGSINFKYSPFKAWKEIGGQRAKGLYPPRALHGIAFKCSFPRICRCREARLMFAEPVSISFDTFPYYLSHDIVPFLWDCWPCYYNKVEEWLRRYKVKAAIFTSRQEMEEISRRLPELKVFHCPEGIDETLYHEGRPLSERTIDLLEFGRSNEIIIPKGFLFEGINHVSTKVGEKFLFSNEQLYAAMADAKLTICLPRSITHPQLAEGVETLTQRYWEAMLSRILIVGHAPQELIDLMGYNPCIEVDFSSPTAQITNILSHISDYQTFVDRNRLKAMEIAPWRIRMKNVRAWLEEIGYQV